MWRARAREHWDSDHFESGISVGHIFFRHKSSNVVNPHEGLIQETNKTIT